MSPELTSLYKTCFLEGATAQKLAIGKRLMEYGMPFAAAVALDTPTEEKALPPPEPEPR